MSDETMWNLQEDRERMWVEDPDRAARLAYVELLKMWDEQVTRGQYRGIPAVHLRSTQPLSDDPPPKKEVVPDGDAGIWMVPGRLRAAWDTAA